MSYELANQRELLGQIASNNGFAEFTDAVDETTYPEISYLIENGISNDVPLLTTELKRLMENTDSDDVRSIAASIISLSADQTTVVVTQGDEQ